MKKSIFKVSSTVVVLVCVLWVCSFSVYAADPLYSFVMPYQEPEVTDNTGYILLLLKGNTSGNYSLRLVEWTYQIIHYGNQGAENFYPITSVTIAIDDDTLIINPLEVAPELTTVFSVTYGYSTGSYGEAHNSYGTFAETEEYEWTTSSYTIEGYQYFGNVNDLVDNLTTHSTFGVIWSDEYAQYTRLKEIRDTLIDILSELASLGDLADGLSDIYEKLKQIYTEMLAQGNSLDSVVAALSDLKSSLTTINSNIVKVNGNVDSVEEELSDVNTNLDSLNDTALEIDNRVLKVYQELLDQGATLDNIKLVLDSISSDTSAIDSKLHNIEIYAKDSRNSLLNINTLVKQLVEQESDSDLQGEDAFDTSTGDDYVSIESDLQNELNFDLDGFGIDMQHNRYNYVWNMISNYWRLNQKIFMVVTLCLCVGIVKLVLNR